MKTKLFMMFFLAVLMLGVVLAETNVSIMYAENSSGSLVPLQVDDQGELKINLDFMNISAGNIESVGNLTLGDKITFAFGEIIDNIVDGWIRVTGNLNVTGNNFSFVGNLLENRDGVLYWKGDLLSTNASINYGQNSSGATLPYRLSGDGVLQMDIVDELWDMAGGVVQLVTPRNVSIDGYLTSTKNGVGISSDISKDDNYVLTSDDKNRVVRLNSSTSGHTNFTLPNSADGTVFRILNDAEHTLTINTTSATDTIWNSGNSYGIDLPDKGTYVELRYSSSANKWDVLQKTGGKVLIEGLVLSYPMDKLVSYGTGTGVTLASDDTGKNNGIVYGDIYFRPKNDGSVPNFDPGVFEFEGAGDYILIYDSTDWDIFGTNTTGHKTIGFWIYHDTIGSEEVIMAHSEDGGNRWFISRNTAGAARIYYVSGGSTEIDTNGGIIPATTWTHVALVINGSDVGLYINGSQVAYDGAWDADTFAATLTIGQVDSGSYIDGRMQDLHISYNNPYNANPNSGSTDSFTLPAAPFRGVME